MPAWCEDLSSLQAFPGAGVTVTTRPSTAIIAHQKFHPHHKRKRTAGNIKLVVWVVVFQGVPKIKVQNLPQFRLF